MVKTLDQRIDEQRRLVQLILAKYDTTVEQLMEFTPGDVDDLDPELLLCWNILRDCDYIDGLR